MQKKNEAKDEQENLATNVSFCSGVKRLPIVTSFSSSVPVSAVVDHLGMLFILDLAFME